MPVSGTSSNPIPVFEQESGLSGITGTLFDVIPVPDSSSEDEDINSTEAFSGPCTATTPFLTPTPDITTSTTATHCTETITPPLVKRKSSFTTKGPHSARNSKVKRLRLSHDNEKSASQSSTEASRKEINAGFLKSGGSRSNRKRKHATDQTVPQSHSRKQDTTPRVASILSVERKQHLGKAHGTPEKCEIRKSQTPKHSVSKSSTSCTQQPISVIDKVSFRKSTNLTNGAQEMNACGGMSSQSTSTGYQSPSSSKGKQAHVNYKAVPNAAGRLDNPRRGTSGLIASSGPSKFDELLLQAQNTSMSTARIVSGARTLPAKKTSEEVNTATATQGIPTAETRHCATGMARGSGKAPVSKRKVARESTSTPSKMKTLGSNNISSSAESYTSLDVDANGQNKSSSKACFQSPTTSSVRTDGGIRGMDDGVTSTVQAASDGSVAVYDASDAHHEQHKGVRIGSETSSDRSSGTAERISGDAHSVNCDLESANAPISKPAQAAQPPAKSDKTEPTQRAAGDMQPQPTYTHEQMVTMTKRDLAVTDELMKLIRCPIYMDTLRDPMITKYGHTYERVCLSVDACLCYNFCTKLLHGLVLVTVGFGLGPRFHQAHTNTYTHTHTVSRCDVCKNACLCVHRKMSVIRMCR
eukprot:m.1238633 g.1238633  ORF g.1238633 m.1238633 type:complete len:641 (+) comp24672_c0_seq6:451-2373(+)